MSRAKLLLSALFLSAVVLFGIFRTAPLTRAAFCNGLVNPYELSGRYVVRVPSATVAEYNRKIAAFMSSHDLTVSTASYASHEPLGKMAPYVAHQTEGCDGHSYIWSDNTSSSSEYFVTFHYNRLFRDRTSPLQRDFVKKMGSHFQIAAYVEPRVGGETP